MHFFSRKKALLTASLAALSGLAACGDDVTVPVQPDTPVVVLITPSNAAMNIGDVLTFAVQVTGGSATAVPTLSTCTSSNSAVATATKDGSSCKVSAVAAGNATVTATASNGSVASSAVSVSAQTAAISGLTVSPATVSLAPSQSVRITPNVTKADTAVATQYSYTSSNTAIATFDSVSASNGTARIVAVAPGVATVTVSVTGTRNGFRTTTLTSAVTVTVGNTPSGITTFTVQPQSLSLAVGRTAGLTATQSQPAGAPVGIITYTSSNTAVATVNATTGLVTAVAPGTANITAKDSSAANAQFATTVLTQIIPVTVSPLANVSIQEINQGPTITSLVDSAYSGVVQNPAGALGNVPIGPAQGVIAGIRKLPNGQINQPIDVTNTKDQIQVVLNLQPNGQRVDSVVVYVDSGTTNTTARRAAARQIFSNGDAGTGATVSITTFILTDDFTPNDVTGNGDVAYVNGLKRISASVWTTLSNGQTCVSGGTPAANNTTPCELQNAANIRQNVNFNNIDGFAIRQTNPANSATDAAGRTWWGGPTVSDIGQASGQGNFVTYPVIFTPGRFIRSVSATFGRCQGFNASSGLPNFVTDSVGPWIFTFGNGAPATPPASSVHIACTAVGAYDQADQFKFEDSPMVVASLDNQNNPGPRVLYAYNPSTTTDSWGGPRVGVLGLWRTSPQLSSPNAIRVDYQAPLLTLAVTQANGERWVNDAYLFNSGYSATDFIDAVVSPTGVGVGLFPTVTAAATPELRNTIFRVASANPACGPQTFQDVNTVGQRRTASIAQVFSIAPNTNRESPCDFTNNAFVAQATETDRLGNRGTVGNLFIPATTNPAAPAVAATPLFGIDNTAPDVQLPYDGSGPIPDMPNIYRATGDSIFQPVNGPVAATPIATTGLATDFWFGARYTDTRSGFNFTNHGTRTVRRFAPNATPLLSNRAVVTVVATRTMTYSGANPAAGNPVETEDPIFRRDSVTIYGAGTLATTTGVNPLVPQTANPAVGYYQYNLTITDRAGNSSTLQERAVIDQTSPIVTGTTIPPVFGATGTATAVAQTFFPTGTDDVENVDWDMFLRYNAMSMVGDSSNGSTVINNGARMRFRRDRFANLHNAWAVFGDTLLATPFGPAAALSGTGMTLPIASIRSLEPVDSTDSPIAYGQAGVVNPFTGFKPNKVGVYGFDVRAEHRSQGTPNGWPVPYDANLPFVNLGMTNLFPTLSPAGGEAGYTENLFVGNISNGTTWDTKDLNPATAGLDRLVSWGGFGGTGSNIEFRAVTSTIVTQPPFPTVHLFKWEIDAQHTGTGLGVLQTTLNDSASGQWVYVGSLNAAAPSNPVINDQGSTRFWRYGFSSSAFPSVTNGMIVQPGVTTGCYRAVGVDASGDGITTRSYGVGCPTAGSFANQTVIVNGPTNQTITLRAYGNGAGTMAATGAATYTLTKSTANGVERVSRNVPNAGGLTVLITPAAGYTIDRAPTGCQLLSPAVYPTTSAVTCQYTTLAPATITVIFETVGAGN